MSYLNGEGLKIWVDADSFARSARQVLEKICIENKSLLFYVGNRDVFLQSSKRENIFEWILVYDVDDYIRTNSQPYDLCITRDIPLASFLLEKGCFVLNDKGNFFTKTFISKASRQGSWNKVLSLAGLERDKTRTYSAQDKRRFCQSLQQFFQKLNKL